MKMLRDFFVVSELLCCLNFVSGIIKSRQVPFDVGNGGCDCDVDRVDFHDDSGVCGSDYFDDGSCDGDEDGYDDDDDDGDAHFSSERKHGSQTFTASVLHDDSPRLEIVCSVAPRVLCSTTGHAAGGFSPVKRACTC